MLAIMPLTTLAQDLIWVQDYEMPSMGNAGARIFTSTTDGQGHTFVTGTFAGNSDLDPGPSTVSFLSKGFLDVFISRFDADGQQLWTSVIGGSQYEYAYDVALDPQGDVILCGSFSGTVDFDPGPGTMEATAIHDQDLYLLKLSGDDGSLIWLRTNGGNELDECQEVALDPAGNIIALGVSYGTMDMDPGPATSPLTSDRNFIWKLTNDGDYIWSGALPGEDAVHLRGLSIFSNGDFVIAGKNWGTLDLDPTAGSTIIGSSGIFVARYSAAGQLLWERHLNGGFINDMVLDTQGNIVLGGEIGITDGQVDLDPGPGTDLHATDREFEAFIWKLDGNGDHLWSRALPSSSDSRLYAIATDAMGNVRCTGTYFADLDADPGPGEHILPYSYPEPMTEDAYVLGLDADGGFLWAGAIAGTGLERTSGVGTDDQGNLFVVGIHHGETDFDPGPGTDLHTGPSPLNAGSNFILRLSAALPMSIATDDVPSTIIHPNPTDDRIQVSTSGPAGYTLFNLQGQLMSSGTSTDMRTTLDLSPFPAGAYVLKLHTEKGIEDHVVVKR
ncbi:MAG TPA: T9SS type A sorting domain-containing protein [Flavobacteriales bacterium]